MTSRNYLTIHRLIALPWNNLNADDRGLPKQVIEGGVVRARLSHQSLKRAAREMYETDAVSLGDRSLRSRNLADEAVRRAQIVAGGTLDEKKARKVAGNAIKFLSTAEAKEQRAIAAAGKRNAGADTTKANTAITGESKDTVTWLSDDEIDTLAAAIANGQDRVEAEEFVSKIVGSLCVASFGRVQAAQPGTYTDGAVAVGPATTTHGAPIQMDYYAAVDDLTLAAGGKSAGYLNHSYYTTGTYYQATTFDRKQLARTWGGFNSAGAEERLNLLVKSLVLALPGGRRNHTAAQTRPAFILAETQSHRTNYQFEEPVRGTGDGYLKPSTSRLIDQAFNARAFDPDTFGDAFISGTDRHVTGIDFNYEDGNLPELTAWVTDWLRG